MAERPIGPVLSSDLYRAESAKLEHLLEDALRNPAKAMVERAADVVADFLQDAYLTGLRDGFVQGVASAHQAPAAGGEERALDFAATLTSVAAFARSLRRRLIGLAFNPDDEAILISEEIEGRAEHVIDKWARREAGTEGSL